MNRKITKKRRTKKIVEIDQWVLLKGYSKTRFDSFIKKFNETQKLIIFNTEKK